MSPADDAQGVAAQLGVTDLTAVSAWLDAGISPDTILGWWPVITEGVGTPQAEWVLALTGAGVPVATVLWAQSGVPVPVTGVPGAVAGGWGSADTSVLPGVDGAAAMVLLQYLRAVQEYRISLLVSQQGAVLGHQRRHPVQGTVSWRQAAVVAHQTRRPGGLARLL